uniref:Uncharacterized protein n=1 Tax=Rhizophora mucronata TaxID=61149 RepID=A0A2P2JP08_RHIMU
MKTLTTTHEPILSKHGGKTDRLFDRTPHGCDRLSPQF